MSRIAILEAEVDDDFEPGACDICPFSYEESNYDEDDGYDYWYNCILCAKYDSCPVKIVEKYNENEEK